MSSFQRYSTPSFLLICLVLISPAFSFVPSYTIARTLPTPQSALKSVPEIFSLSLKTFEPASSSSTNLVSLATIDPTTFVSDSLGLLLGSSAILAVPIVVALGIVGLFAFFVVSYANPADED